MSSQYNRQNASQTQEGHNDAYYQHQQYSQYPASGYPHSRGASAGHSGASQNPYPSHRQYTYGDGSYYDAVSAQQQRYYQTSYASPVSSYFRAYPNYPPNQSNYQYPHAVSDQTSQMPPSQYPPHSGPIYPCLPASSQQADYSAYYHTYPANYQQPHLYTQYRSQGHFEPHHSQRIDQQVCASPAQTPFKSSANAPFGVLPLEIDNQVSSDFASQESPSDISSSQLHKPESGSPNCYPIQQQQQPQLHQNPALQIRNRIPYQYPSPITDAPAKPQNPANSSTVQHDSSQTSVSSETVRNFVFDQKIPQYYDSTLSQSFSQDSVANMDSEDGNHDELLRNSQFKIQQLIDLSDTYLHHAHSQIHKIKSKKNLKEYYTLIQLSISALLKVLALNRKTSDALSIKLNLKLAKILIEETVINAEFCEDDITPDHFLDQALIICGLSPEYAFFKLEAEYLLAQLMIRRGKYKQCIKFLDTAIDHSSIDPTLLVYSKYNLMLHYDSSQALGFLVTFLKSDEFKQLNKNIRDLFKLNEISISLYRGVKPSNDIGEISPDHISLKMMKLFLEVLWFMTYREPSQINQLESKCRGLALYLSDHKNHFSKPYFYVDYQISNLVLKLKVDWMDFNALNIVFTLFYGVAVLQNSWDKRKSRSLFTRALESIDKEISLFNKFQVNLKQIDITITRLKYIKNLVNFYKLVEVSIVESIPAASISEFSSLLESSSLDTSFGFSNKQFYLKGLKDQLDGDLQGAKNEFLNFKATQQYTIPDECGIGNPLYSPTAYYSDLYLFSLMNMLLITESNFRYYTRIEDKNVVQLNQQRRSLYDEINKFMIQKNSSVQDKYLITTAFKMIQLIYNSNENSIFKITEDIEVILEEFETLKRFPLLCSLLLYIKSTNLNKNSDQKQKSSQTAFNLAKLGFSPLVRYFTGVLNQNNALIAKNMQQVEIQSQKLEKLSKHIGSRYNNMHGNTFS